MANKWMVASGNWSNAANWNGGAKPVAGDDVFANNFTCTVDENINVASLRNTSGTGITVGGSFVFSVAGVIATITGAQAVVNGSGTVCTISAASGSVTFNCSGQVSGAINATGVIVHSGACDFYLNAVSITGGSNITAVVFSSSGTMYVTATVNGGAVGGSSACGIQHTGTGHLVIVGNVTGGSTSSGSMGAGAGVQITSASFGRLTVTGTVTGGSSGAAAVGISVTTNFTQITVTGPVNGGAAAVGINLAANIPMTIVGNITAGVAAGINSTSTNNVSITGNLVASSTAAAIVHNATNASLTIAGGVVNTSGRQAFISPIVYFNSSVAASWTVQDPLLVSRTMATDNALPSPSNVRAGVAYGAALSLTGTLVVPSPSNVVNGVPTDNTVGTYTTTPAAIAAEVWSYSTRGLTESPDVPTVEEISLQVWTDQPERLFNVATVESTGNQIAALT